MEDVVKKICLLVLLILLVFCKFGFSISYVSQVPLNGGEVNEIAICVSNPTIIYAGAGHGWLWKSIDSGENWVPTKFYEATESGADVLVVHPTNANIVMARASEYGRLFKSEDGGETWAEIGTNDFYSKVSIVKIVASEKTPGTFYLLANDLLILDGVIFKSIDAGSTWTKTNFTSGGKGVTDFCIDKDDVIYVGAINVTPQSFVKFEQANSGELFKSTDGGTNWQIIKTFNSAVAFTSISSNTLAVVTANGSEPGVYISTTSGTGFVYKNIPWVGTGDAITVSTDGAKVYFLSFSIIKLSTMTSTDWSDFIAISTGAVNGNRTIWSKNILIDPSNPNNFYMNDWYENAFLKSTDTAVTWRVSNKGINGLLVYEGCKDPAGNIYVLGRAGIFKSIDNGLTWNEVYNPSVVYGQVIQFDAGVISAPTTSHVYAAGADRLWTSSDAGTTWTEVIYSSGFAPAKNIVFNKTNPAIGYAAFRKINTTAVTSNKYIYKTTDYGATWTQLNLEGMSVQALAIDPINPTILYAGLGEIADWQETVYAGGGIYRIVDDGTSVSWTKLGLDNKSPYRIAVDTTGVIYAASCDVGSRTTGPLYISRDNGVTWNQFNITSESGSDLWTSAGGPKDLEYSDSIVYFCNWNGVYGSVNNGETFQLIAEKKDVGTPSCLIIGSMYTGASRGFYKLTWSGSTILTETISKPKVYAFPNPFNANSVAVTTLKYMVPQNKTVTSLKISIYNIAGELVYEESDNTLLSGGRGYYYTWDGTNQSGEKCAEGVYIVVFDSNLDTARTKIVIVH